MSRAKKMAFIDPFIVMPAVHCFNDMVQRVNLPLNYYMPDKFGVESLIKRSDEFSAYFLGGSASNVTEPLAWHLPLAHFLLEELRRGKPVLAVCFGHQLLCHALGSSVGDYSPEGVKLQGVREIFVKENFLNFKSEESLILPISHKQVVMTLAPGLIEVGVGLPNDIVVHENLPLVSTQAHPEASHYFCHHTIGNLSSHEEDTGRTHGQKLIDQFFQYYQLL